VNESRQTLRAAKRVEHGKRLSVRWRTDAKEDVLQAVVRSGSNADRMRVAEVSHRRIGPTVDDALNRFNS
jgi:hypothetical protein